MHACDVSSCKTHHLRVTWHRKLKRFPCFVHFCLTTLISKTSPSKHINVQTQKEPKATVSSRLFLCKCSVRLCTPAAFSSFFPAAISNWMSRVGVRAMLNYKLFQTMDSFLIILWIRTQRESFSHSYLSDLFLSYCSAGI